MRVGETVPPDTRVLLEKLGLWQRFLTQGHHPTLGSCSSWGSADLGYNDFLMNAHGHGWHLDRKRFDEFLRNSAISAGVAIFVPMKVVGFETAGDDAFCLHTVHAERASLNARYVVDATGIHSAFARRAGAVQLLTDRLTCVCGFFEASSGASRSQLAMLEATEEGWWYCAALPNRRVAVMFATDSSTVRDHRLTLENPWFARLLRTSHIAPRLDGCRLLAGEMATCVAPSFALNRASGARWLAVGDAASCYDPLSSAGIYKALSDGVNAGEAIAAALESASAIPPQYAAAVAADYRAYELHRDDLYRRERRWSDSPFWRRRLGSRKKSRAA